MFRFQTFRIQNGQDRKSSELASFFFKVGEFLAAEIQIPLLVNVNVFLQNKGIWRYYSHSEVYGGHRETFSGQIQVLCLDSCLLSLYLDAGCIMHSSLLSQGVVNKNATFSPQKHVCNGISFLSVHAWKSPNTLNFFEQERFQKCL